MRNSPSDREEENERAKVPEWVKEILGIGLLSVIISGGITTLVLKTDGMVIQEGSGNNSEADNSKIKTDLKAKERSEKASEMTSKILHDLFVFHDQTEGKRVLQLSNNYVLYFGEGNNDEHGSVLSIRFNPKNHSSSPVSIRKDGSVSEDTLKVTVSVGIKKFTNRTLRKHLYSLTSEDSSKSGTSPYGRSQIESCLKQALKKCKAGDYGMFMDDFTLPKGNTLENQGSVDKDDLTDFRMIGVDGKPMEAKIDDR